MGLTKKILLSLGIIVIIVLVVFFFVYRSAVSSSTSKAQLHIETGSVLVNGIVSKSGVLLNEGDTIETGTGAKASVILYESIIVSLDPSTKITLKELTQSYPKISQENGMTWNKFTKFSGVNNYQITSGNTVASVRGTFFGFSKNKIITGEGLVDATILGNLTLLSEGFVFEDVNGTIIKRNATIQELREIKQALIRIIGELKFLRQSEINKHKALFNIIKSKYSITDADVKNLFDNADNGLVDLDELIKQSPVNLDSLDKIVKITKKIQEMNSALNKLSNYTL